jgi:hypothetical protein
MRISAVDALNMRLIANGQLGITPIPFCENYISKYLCNFRLYKLLTNEIPAEEALNIALIAKGQLVITPIPYCDNYILYY